MTTPIKAIPVNKRGDRFWLIPVDGFDDQVVLAATAGKAKWATYRAGKEAGYFSRGAAAFFAVVGMPREIAYDEVERRIGGHRPIGAPEGWRITP